MGLKVTRRQVVAAAAALPVVGALACGGLAWRWWDRPPGQGLAALSTDEHELVQALAEAWMPPGGDPPISGAEAQLGRFFDDLVAASEPGTRVELKLLLQVLDDATIPTHARSFRWLPLEQRTEVVDAWLHSDQWLLRNAITGVLVLMAEGYSMHPEVIGLLRPHFRCGYGP